MVTFTGRQARLDRAGARHNELARIVQNSYPYPQESAAAADYLFFESDAGRDAYFGVHLFRERGNRLASNAVPLIRALWLDEDEGTFPEIGPDPTAVVASSAARRHLYWQLSRPISVEWAVSMNRRLAVWAGGDTGKAGLASVLRVPGTLNFKRHPQVDPVTLEITGAPAWNPEVMDQAIPEIVELPASLREGSTEPYDGPELELEEFLTGVEVIGEVPDRLGTKRAVVCPWVHEHSGGARSGTYVGQREGGGLWFHCNHAHCTGRGWAEFRRAARLKAKKLTLVRRGIYV